MTMTSSKDQRPGGAPVGHQSRPGGQTASSSPARGELVGKSYDEQVAALAPAGPGDPPGKGTHVGEATDEQLARADHIVLISKTDWNSGADIAKRLCGHSDQLVEVSLTWRQLVAFGATGKLPVAAAPIGRHPRDYVEVNGQAMTAAGGTASSFFVDGRTGDSAPIHFKLSNNGVLNLHRVAIDAHAQATRRGASADNGWRMRPSEGLAVLLGMQVGNDPKAAGARASGARVGITPHDVVPMLNSAWKSAATAFRAEKAGGPERAGQRVAASHNEGRLYRTAKPDHVAVTPGMSWSEETRAKLNYALGSVLSDAGRPTPILYIPDRPDFSPAIDRLFAATEAGAAHAVLRFMEELRAILKEHLDLSWLKGADPAFAARFEAQWHRAIDAAFAQSVLFENIQLELETMHRERTYTRAPYEVKQPTSTIRDNASGRVDGEARAGALPDMSAWVDHPSPAAPPEGELGREQEVDADPGESRETAREAQAVPTPAPGDRAKKPEMREGEPLSVRAPREGGRGAREQRQAKKRAKAIARYDRKKKRKGEIRSILVI